MIQSLMVAVLLLGGSASWAAIPKKTIDSKKSVVSALRASPKRRMAILKKQGKTGFRALRQIAFGEEHTVEARWKALTTMARIAGPEAKPELEGALKSRDWFMRDAGLKAMEKVAPSDAKVWARRLVNDPALVVRSSAVRTLDRLNDASAKSLLWERLYSPQNYRGKQSLWVRKHIVQALAKFAKSGEEEKFVKILGDQDKALHRPATQALRRLTGIKPGKKTLEAESSFWISWWDSRKI